MFDFFKKKLKGAVSEISEKIDEEGEEEIKEAPEEKKEKSEQEAKEKKEEKAPEETPEKEEKKGFFSKIFSKKEELESVPEEQMEEVPIEKLEKQAEQEKEEEEKGKKTEEEQQKAEKKVKQDLEKGEIPSIQNLTERKKQIKEEAKKAEEKKEEEKKEELPADEKSYEESHTEEAKEDIDEDRSITEEPESAEKEESSEESAKEKKPEDKESGTPDSEQAETFPAEAKEDAEDIEEKKGMFSKFKEKIVTKKITESQFDSLFWDLELALLENNVAVEVIEKMKKDLREKLVDKPIKRSEISSIISKTLGETVKGLFDVEQFDILEKAKEKKPLVICFVGINGSGKTTTIAKVARLLQDNGMSCVLAASDTFRAAAIDQLQQHADNLGVKLIKHDYGSDAAAVAYDAISHARSKDIDAVLIDTAGRIHSNVNLMDEMKKIIKVADPDLKIFVGESITGNDCTEQAKKFNEAVGIDGIILSKADIDEKGGAAISVSYITGKPILYLGNGQEYSDLKKFDPGIIVESLGL